MFSIAMNSVGRIVLISYCILVIYCCLWVPWRVEYNPVSEYARIRYMRQGYGWLWAGPRIMVSEPDPNSFVPAPPGKGNDGSGWTVVGEESVRRIPQAGLIYAEPDTRLIALRLIAATAVATAAFLASGFLARSRAS
jgi:uncharacterized protein with PQ loop repeat